MSQALHLMNAPELELRLASPGGRIAALVKSGATTAAIIDELSLVALGRMPSPSEQELGRELFEQAPPRQAAEDFLWTLLNSYDFLFIR